MDWVWGRIDVGGDYKWCTNNANVLLTCVFCWRVLIGYRILSVKCQIWTRRISLRMIGVIFAVAYLRVFMYTFHNIFVFMHMHTPEHNSKFLSTSTCMCISIYMYVYNRVNNSNNMRVRKHKLWRKYSCHMNTYLYTLFIIQTGAYKPKPLISRIKIRHSKTSHLSSWHKMTIVW